MKEHFICTDTTVETPMFVKRFALNGTCRVTLDITGLGYFFFLINGKRVTDDLFTPAQTDYAPRDTSKFLYPISDCLTHKVFYLTYDITDFVKTGENTLSVVVGNGWFRQKERIAEGNTDYSDTVCTAFAIHIEQNDGSITTLFSDDDVDCYVYPILKSNLFLGDTIDTRMFQKPLPTAPTYRYDASHLGELTKQTCPFDRVIRTLTPKLLHNGIYDVGENITGRVVITATGKSGDTLSVYHAEEYSENALSYGSSGGGYLCGGGLHQIQQDHYILNGDKQELFPEFAWHGFRYFKIEGDVTPDAVTVEVIHTDLPVTSSFKCSNEVLNWLFDAFHRSLLSNFHSSIPSDCPHRERLGYTGDGQVTSLAAMLTLDCKSAYRKWIGDIFDCQCQKSGHVQHTAPFGGGGGGPGGWGCAIVFVPYQYHKVYGDTDLIRDALPRMEKWIDYLEAHCEGGLVVSEEPDGWCLGDWCAPFEPSMPTEYVNTCCTIKALLCMAELADAVGKDKTAYLEKAKAHKKALFNAFYQNGSYLGGIQGADAYALWAELDGDGVAENLIARYEERNTFDTGFIGTEILCDTLFTLGRGDLAIKLMGSDDDKVGFNFMRQNGATTLYECLDTTGASHNHPMFGGCVHTLFTGLFGIRLKGGKATLAPCLTSGLAYASGSLTLPQGKIAVTIDADTLTLDTAFPIEVTLYGKTTLAPIGKTAFSLL